jgi:CRP-like cAMP-binding protein
MAKQRKNGKVEKGTPKKAAAKASTTRSALTANNATGCCKILIPGEKPKFHAGITEFQCEQMANGIGGASYHFDEGVDCHGTEFLDEPSLAAILQTPKIKKIKQNLNEASSNALRGPWESKPRIVNDSKPDILAKEAWLTLNGEDIQWLIENGETILYKKEEIILSPESEATNLYVIISGAALVHAENGFTTSLNTGCVAGELSFLSGKRPMARVIALPNSIIHKIPVDKIRARGTKDLPFLFKLTSILSAFSVFRLQTHLGEIESYSPTKATSEKFKKFLSSFKAS